MRYLYCSVLVGLLAAEAGHAQSSTATETPAGEPAQTLKKISVSATRGPEELGNIPASVTVLDSEMLRREIARDIKDLIRYEPGVSVANASTRFGLAGFNIRGIEANRVATRIDGIRMNDAFSIGSYSNARRNLVDLETVKAVEIVRGPASALYGSDAIGGIVSFVTKDPQDVLAPGEAFAVQAHSEYRSDSDTRELGSTLAGAGEQLGALLIYEHGEGNELENRGTRSTHDNTRTAPNPQDRTSDSALGKLTWKLSDTQTLRLTLAYDRDETKTDVLSTQGRGAGAFANIFTVGLDGDDRQERKRATLEHGIDASWLVADQLEWRLYVQNTQIEQRSLEERYTFSAGPASTVFRDRLFSFQQDTLGAEVLARKELAATGARHRLTYGVELLKTDTEQLRDGRQTTQATGVVTKNISPDSFPVRDFPKSTADQYALYVQDQIELADGALHVIPGVRADYYKLEPDVDAVYRADNPGVRTTDLDETSVSPKLGVVWWFTDALSTYANYARGFRAPPYNDVNIGFTNLAFGYTAIANPDLKPETSNGYEVGLRGELERGFLSLAAFYNDYDDFIESLSLVGVQNGLQVFQSRNLSKAHIYGTELRAGMALFDGRVHVRSTVAYARGVGSSIAEGPERPINSVDPLKAVLGVRYQPADRWSVELIGTAAERRRHVNQSTPQFVPDGYFVVDLLAEASFGEHARFNLGVFNLTDEKYWDWIDVRGLSPTSPTLARYTRPGINVGASVAVQF